jgi:hypothetical protein
VVIDVLEHSLYPFQVTQAALFHPGIDGNGGEIAYQGGADVVDPAFYKEGISLLSLLLLPIDSLYTLSEGLQDLVVHGSLINQAADQKGGKESLLRRPPRGMTYHFRMENDQIHLCIFLEIFKIMNIPTSGYSHISSVENIVFLVDPHLETSAADIDKFYVSVPVGHKGQVVTSGDGDGKIRIIRTMFMECLHEDTSCHL